MKYHISEYELGYETTRLVVEANEKAHEIRCVERDSPVGVELILDRLYRQYDSLIEAIRPSVRGILNSRAVATGDDRYIPREGDEVLIVQYGELPPWIHPINGVDGLVLAVRM